MKHMCRARIVWGRTETHVNVAERDFLFSVSSLATHTVIRCLLQNISALL